MSATVWEILEMKCVQWPETENMWIYWNLFEKIREITSIELKFGGFYPFETTVQQTANSLKTAELSKNQRSLQRLETCEFNKDGFLIIKNKWFDTFR